MQWSREQRSTGGAGSHARWLKHGGTHASQRDLDRGSGVSVTPAHGLKALQHHHPRHPPLRRLKTAASAARLPPGVASSLDGGAAGDITPIADAVRSLAAASGAGRRAGAATRPAALSAVAPEGLTPSLTGLDLPAEDETVDEAAVAASAAAAARLQESEEALRVRSIVLLRHMSWIASPAATRLAVQVRPYAEKEGGRATHTPAALSSQCLLLSSLPLSGGLAHAVPSGRHDVRDERSCRLPLPLRCLRGAHASAPRPLQPPARHRSQVAQRAWLWL